MPIARDETERTYGGYISMHGVGMDYLCAS